MLFLISYQPSDMELAENGLVYYLNQIQQMKMDNKTTLLVEMTHLREADQTLAETVASDFRRYWP